jgi:acetyl esterase/lipase
MEPIFPTHLQAQVMPLWEEDISAGIDADRPEEFAFLEDGLKVIRNVARPTLTAYLPDPAIASGTAVVVCPGGGYHFLAFEHEGTAVASWLNAHGVAAFLLKYRLVQTGEDFPQCVWQNLDNLSVALHSGPSSRPNFAAAIYSAPPLDAPIPPDAPPLFLAAAADDEMGATTSADFYAKWIKAGRPVELHIYARGGHGFGMRRLGLPSDGWIERFAEWLRSEGFLRSIPS